MELTELTRRQLERLYHSRMKEDFPPSELKPLWAMTSMMDKGRYQALGVVEGGRVLGYALLWRTPEQPFVLLDYLGTQPDLRGRGLGGAILEELKGRCQALRGILVESEAPESGDPSGAELRRRRLDFYRRNGYGDAGYDCRIFGVDYRALVYSPAQVGREEALAAHRAIYRGAFTQERFEKYVIIPLPAQDGKADLI